MPKIPLCNRCLYCAHDPHLVCALYPNGPNEDSCNDFTPNPELEDKRFTNFLNIPTTSEGTEEEQWEPEGARYSGGELIIQREDIPPYLTYYNGEEIVQPRQRWTTQQQLQLLDWHPMFTGKCPSCGASFEKDYIARVHWDCPHCGWMDDTV
jgi:hypothetical protein